MASMMKFATPGDGKPEAGTLAELGGAPTTYIARQPIVDRQQQIFGYELFSRTSEQAQSSTVHHSAATDTALMFNALSNFGTDALFGDKAAFVNCAIDGLSGEHFEIVFSDHIVLELPRVPGDDPAGIVAMAEQAKSLRQRGFSIALGAFGVTKAYAVLLPLVSYVKVDVLSVPAPAVEQIVRLAALHKNLKLVAEKIETSDQYRRHFDLGFHYFQGFYFARPQTVAAKVVNPAYANVLQLMDLVLKHAELHEIEEVLKRDPALSFKLLRYINSSGFGLMCEITSFRHAVMILGFNKLFRWLTLLFATVRNGSVAPALARTAVTRGRMMELLGHKLLSPDECDNAFVVGIFSTLDVMLGVSMEKALSSVQLPENVSDALLHRQGVLGPFLQVVEACENSDFETLEMLAMALQLDGAEVSEAHLHALAWTETLGI